MTHQQSDSSIWPKPFLLDLYQRAVLHGCLKVSPIAETAAKSLTQAFYRLRRRADKSATSFIEPEFQLVSVSHWTPDEGGRIYIIYSALPEGVALPNVSVVPREEATTAFAPPTPASSLPDDLILDVEDIDVNAFVSSLRKP